MLADFLSKAVCKEVIDLNSEAILTTHSDVERVIKEMTNGKDIGNYPTEVASLYHVIKPNVHEKRQFDKPDRKLYGTNDNYVCVMYGIPLGPSQIIACECVDLKRDTQQYDDDNATVR